MQKLDSVLLIDDDHIANSLNKIIVKKLDISDHLIIATNGQIAMDIINENCKNNHDCPRLIFLDINMPVMNGFEFLNAFENSRVQNKASVIIIMLSTSENPKDIQNSKHPCVSGFLNKPLNEQKVIEIMTKYFN